jgi:hypothetical protein
MSKLSKKLTIFYPNEPMLSLYVASACQLTCQECIMMSLMKKEPKYQMSLEEVENLLKINELSSYNYHYRLTGGEPLLWTHILPALHKIRASNTCLSISIITNAMNISKIDDELISLVDCIRISKYQSNHKNIEIIKEKYPETILVVDREKFYKNPTEPVKGSTPVECGNPELMYYNNKIYACPHAESIAIKFNLNDIELSRPLEKDYKKDMPQIREGQEKICELCIGNNKVKKAMSKIKNLNKKYKLL